MKYNGLQFNAHAMGALHGVLYTNSLEAFLHWYARGVRHFEVDVNMTRDGAFVLSHDIKRVASQSKKEFLADRRVGILGRAVLNGTPMGLQDGFDLLLEYPNVNFMFDFYPGFFATEDDGSRLLKSFCRAFADNAIRERSLIEVGSLECAKIVQDSGYKNVQLWIDKSDKLYSESEIETLLSHEIRYVSLDPRNITKEYVRALKDVGVIVYSPGYDAYRGCQDAMRLGLDFATMHYPFYRSGSVLGYVGWRMYKRFPRLAGFCERGVL